MGQLEYLKTFFDVSEVNIIPEVQLTTNTMYCKKAVSLAYMILNDLSITDAGNQAYGQNLLFNFDRMFEEFIKRILTVYSVIMDLHIGLMKIICYL